MNIADDLGITKLPKIAKLHGAAIEICSACNHRCVYCPVSSNPFPQQVMSAEVFIRVLNELATLGTHLERLSFNHYNEPFLDPLIVQRVREAVTFEFFEFILLNTNLSILRDEVVDALLPYRDRLEFNVNLPSTDAATYEALHGRKEFHRVMRNLERVAGLGFRTAVNIQLSSLNRERKFDASVLPPGVKVELMLSTSRAGLVRPLATGVREGRLVGCRAYRPTRYIHIGVDGAVFLCCEDYDKKTIAGNVCASPLREILRSEEMRRNLARLYGQVDAPADFICRSCEYALFAKTGSPVEAAVEERS